ncbi:hypothetical protein FRC14_000233 [Serendipita sp. 396]|nr:hypothetical protein FRC14_000233 [Serendipita sp. 396]KAG8786865.1 hypothetical protein FRC15_010517 [Serendipita sp. 397]KAG8799503.1 hypothetical protein FRC16_004985 [Serendipita sp. 398]KAG8860171.1 hypothetical protein FRC20_011691 [Serendipita sp. 405]
MGAEGGIEDFILNKVLQSKLYWDSIQSEEIRLQIIEGAIKNLKSAIPGAKHALEVQKHNLEAFLAMRTRISDMESVFSSQIEDEETSRKLCENLQYILSKQTKVWVKLTDTLIIFAQNRLSEIDQTCRRLEAELRSWTFSRNVHQKSLTQSRSVLKEIQRELYTAKRTLQKVPVEVWIAIFRWRTQGDLYEFYTTHNTRPFQPTAMILSAVCHSWRDIIAQEPDLWRHIAIHPCASWSDNKIELLKFSLDMAKRQKVLISNISQSLFWNRQTYYKEQGKLVVPVRVDSSIVSGSYDITIVTDADDHNTMSTRAGGLPFRDPRSLTLVNRLGYQHGYFFSYIPSSKNVISLEVVDPTPRNLNSLQLTSRFPNLTQFSLQVDRFPKDMTDLNILLPPGLQTLCVRHSGQSYFRTVANVHLPHLNTLEITPPIASLFESIDAPSLQQLNLCGPQSIAILIPIPPADGSKIRLQSVKQLEFHNWLDPILIRGLKTCDAVNTLRDWSAQMPQVRRLKFLDSYVDGNGLLDLLWSLKHENVLAGAGLEEITLDCCTGITRYECEELKELVGKVNVFG